MDKVRTAGVGQPVGVFGVMSPASFPLIISSASSGGTNKLLSELSPAPETPGIVETIELERIAAKNGDFASKLALEDMKDMCGLYLI